MYANIITMQNEDDFVNLREKMVREQLMNRDIKDKNILNAFKAIPRHKFVLQENKASSYSDCPLPIGENQTISQPYMVALMTQVLDVKSTDKVLEIGTGSGYQTAILAYLAGEIFSIERKEILAKRAEATLKELGFINTKIKIDDGTCGWIENAPFDKIMVTAAAPDLPLPLYEQLKTGGKLAAPITSSFSQILTIFIKDDYKMKKEEVCGCSFVPLIGKFGYKDKQLT